MDLGCGTEPVIKAEPEDEEWRTEGNPFADPHNEVQIKEETTSNVPVGSSPVSGLKTVIPKCVNGESHPVTELADNGTSSRYEGNVDDCRSDEANTTFEGQCKAVKTEVSVGSCEDDDYDAIGATWLDMTSPAQVRKKKKQSLGDDKNLYCEFCSYTCTRCSDLERHLRIHTGERPFPCHLCDYYATRASHLKVHLRTHTGERPYKCDLCDYAGADSGHLRAHKMTHSGERPHACNVCGLACKRSHDLNVHLRLHTGERPYVCNSCDFASNRASHLKSHMKSKRHQRLKGFAPDVLLNENKDVYVEFRTSNLPAADY